MASQAAPLTIAKSPATHCTVLTIPQVILLLPSFLTLSFFDIVNVLLQYCLSVAQDEQR
jgi:hypothetical protein